MSIQNALNLTATGIVSHNGSGVFAGRTISVTASTGISVSNGDGVSGNPTIAGISASDTVAGVIELASDSETVVGTATNRATTPANITARLLAPGAIGTTTPCTQLVVDDITFNAGTIQGTAAAALTISPTAGQVLELDDSNFTVDGGVAIVSGSLTVDTIIFNGSNIGLTSGNLLTSDIAQIVQSDAVSGGNVLLRAYNTANTASSDAFVASRVAGTSGGDAYFQWAINGGQTFVAGIDNSDSDAWVLSRGAAIGTTNALRVDTSGGIQLTPTAGQPITLDADITVDGGVIQGTAAATLQINATAGQVLTLNESITVDGSTIRDTAAASFTIGATAGQLTLIDDTNFSVDGGVAIITGDLTVDSINLNGAVIGFGATAVMTLNSIGAATYTLQPSFLAFAGTQENITGDATDYTMTFGTEIIDKNADFDGTSTLTTPITSLWNLSGYLRPGGILSGHVSNDFITTSNRNYGISRANIFAAGNGGVTFGEPFGYNCDMDAADTATIHTIVSGATKTIDHGSNSFFCGWMLG